MKGQESLVYFFNYKNYSSDKNDSRSNVFLYNFIHFQFSEFLPHLFPNNLTQNPNIKN